MSKMIKRTEETVVELPFIEACKKVGYTYIDGKTFSPENGTNERLTLKDPLLNQVLISQILKLNPKDEYYHLDLSKRQVDEVISKLKDLDGDIFEVNKKIYDFITLGVPLMVETKTGKKERFIKLLSDDHTQNVYHVVNQFKVNGDKENIKTDIVLFINGIPMVLVECKFSGTETNPLTSAINQLNVYKRKTPKLFYYNQILVATFKEKAIAGSITSSATYFNEWKTTYPFEDTAQNSQERMIQGMLNPETLIDIIFYHINFEGSEKKIPRYQQYRAVNKILKRVSLVSSPKIERGGVVFHTQRSGKTLTIINLAKKLHVKFPDSKIVFFVDRTDLEKQHLQTFKKILKRNIVEIDSAEDLQAELKTNTSNLVFSMIHKFRDDEVFPELNTSSKIIVVVDEAHRSQYRTLGSNLNKALPNAPKIGFTGTPLFKDNKTTNEFGTIIDDYTRSQAVSDGCTVPLKYENRVPNVDADIQAIKDDESFILSGLTKEQKQAGIKAFVNQSTIYNSESVIKVICKDIIKDYNSTVLSEGFKAMLVVQDRKIALEYLRMLEALNGPKATIVISGDHNDPVELKPYTDNQKHEEVKSNFTSKDGDIKILIVVDKLLTGFDAPIVQTMYFCKKLKEHNLGQAMDRPVTPYPNKTFGRIVDYCGIRDDLEETIRLFDRQEDRENVYEDVAGGIKVIENNWKDFKNKAKDIDMTSDESYEKSLLKYTDENKRESLIESFKKLQRSINDVLPNQEAGKYASMSSKYITFMKELNGLFKREELDLSDIGEKIKSILNDHIKTENITGSIAIDILSPEFSKAIEKKSEDVQSAEAEYAIKKYIKTNKKHDPVFFDKMADKVAQVLENFKENNKERLKALLKLKDEILNQKEEAEKLGLILEDLPPLHFLQDFIEKRTSFDSQSPRVLDVFKKLKESVSEKKKQKDGLDKQSSIRDFKTEVADAMTEFFDENGSVDDYEIYYDQAEDLAMSLIEKYR